MHDLHPSSKRTTLALRFFSFGVMTVSTVALSTILILFALGYRLDKSLHFSQGGLVQFVSVPANASVTVDGQLQNIRTPDKLNMDAGQHTITMSLDGYRSWSKTVGLAPGQLLWLNYVRLIPDTVNSSSVRELDHLTDMVASPDKRWLLLQLQPDSLNFTLANVADEKNPKFTDLTLPDGLFTKQNGAYGTISIVEWQADSQHILLKHQIGSTTEFAVVDRDKPAEAVNITKLFGLNILEAHYSKDNGSIVFANTDGILRRLDIGGKSASGSLVSGLKSFVVQNSEKIAFTAEGSTSGQTAQMYIGTWHDNKTTQVASADAGRQPLIAYGQYYGHEYLAYGFTDDSRVTILRDPATATSQQSVFTNFDLGASLKWLTFSDNGRMLVAQNENRFASYDLEEAKSYQQQLNLGSGADTQLRWLDDFYLWTNAGNELRLVEFDGSNERDIVSAQAPFTASLSSNGRRLFSIAKVTSNVWVLQSSALVTD